MMPRCTLARAAVHRHPSTGIVRDSPRTQLHSQRRVWTEALGGEVEGAAVHDAPLHTGQGGSHLGLHLCLPDLLCCRNHLHDRNTWNVSHEQSAAVPVQFGKPLRNNVMRFDHAQLQE